MKKRKYWPKYINGDKIDYHFENKGDGHVDSFPGNMYNTSFHIFGMKMYNYIMKILCAYGIDEL